MKNNFFEKNGDYFYLVFRVVVGLLFMMHGAMKWGAITSLSFGNLMFYAGIIELVAGAFILIGLFTRTSALISALQMAYAFIFVHVIGNNTLNPLANKGEPALLFFVAFLVILAFGARKFSVDEMICKK